MHSIIQGVIDSRRKKSQKGQAVSVSSQPWTRCTPVKIWKKFSTIWTNPELRCTKILGEFTEIQCIGAIWRSLKEKDCSSIKPRSLAIALFNTPPAICIERVEYGMKTGEDWNCNVHQFPRLPRVVLTPKLQRGRQDLSNLEARKSTNHQSEQSVKYREICRSHFEDTRRKHPEENQQRLSTGKLVAVTLITEFQVHLTQLSRKEDSNRKETVRKTDSTARESSRTVTR